jgi:hypothetical protein
MSMAKQSTSSKPQPTAIEQAQAVIADLEAKHAACIARATEIAKECDALAYDAHAAGDEKSRAKLDRLREEATKEDHNVGTIKSALKVAHERLAAEEHKEAVKADRARALLLREETIKITEHMRIADEFFGAAVESLSAANAGIEQIHNKLGEPFPTATQMKVFVEIALHTMIQTLPRPWWRDWLRPLAPLQRRAFASVWAGMARRLENIVRQRLGEAPLAGPEPSAPPPLVHHTEHDDGGQEAAALAAHRERMAERRERDIARSTEIAGAIGSMK